MANDFLAPSFLFKLLEAAGISKKDVASRLGVSKTLVTLWSQAKRSIGWAHYEALLDLIFDPETMWKIAQRLKAEGPILGMHPFQPLTPNYLLFHLITLSSQYKRRTIELYEDIKSITHQLAACTSGEPATWDIPSLQRLSHSLADHLKDAPLLTQFEAHVEKGLPTINDAIRDAHS